MLSSTFLDEDGVYDPAHFNDRLLLGLKGTMSEAELHVLRARLQGGIRNKARRGELVITPPIGLAYATTGTLGLDPDTQVQAALRLVFATFRRTGSATAIVKTFRRQGLLFPRRVHAGPRQDEVVWTALGHTQALRVLHNPRYTGAFVYGRTRTRKTLDGRDTLVRVPPAAWDTVIRGAHAGYLTWEEYEENQRRLHASAQAFGANRRQSPPREGPALLQGLVLCGRCGERMTVRYHVRRGRQWPEYLCQRAGVERGTPPCQRVPGAGLDQAVGEVLVAAVSPVALEVALTVQQELQARRDEADRLRDQQVDRAQYEADLARRRYMQGDPANRFVADSLEAEWNSRLRALSEAQQVRERQREQDRQVLSAEQRAAILALATDVPRLWRDPQTPDRERKRMVRLLLEDVTVRRDPGITLHLRFKGGATHTLSLPLPGNAWQQRTTAPAVVQAIDQLLAHHTVPEIATQLNARGLRSGEGQAFTAVIVARILTRYHLLPRYDRLRQAGLLTREEMATLLGISQSQVKVWRQQGLLRGHAYTARPDWLYEHPGAHPPRKAQGVKFSQRRLPEFTPEQAKEVQCEA
jgi:hypothetical protein